MGGFTGCHVARAADAEVLIRAPGGGAVVDENVVGLVSDRADGIDFPAAVLAVACVAGADGDVLAYHIVSLDRDAASDERDAGRGCGLTGDGAERFRDFEDALRGFAASENAAKIDHAADLEDNDTRAAGFDGLAERTRTGRVQVGDLDDLSAVATTGFPAELAFWKRGWRIKPQDRCGGAERQCGSRLVKRGPGVFL